MKVTPLAADSMGVRSSATLVETERINIVIDPGADLAPMRYGLPPSEEEKDTLDELRATIMNAVDTADIIIISHYHHDHFDPGANHFQGKRIFLKSWEADINHSQRTRALKLRDRFNDMGIGSDVILADGTCHLLDDSLKLEFSHAVPHGVIGTKTGYVIMTLVRESGFTFMYSSDVSGPIEPSSARMIIECDPDLIYLDGPPINLLETHLNRADLEKAINNILDILELTRARLIFDHHHMRDVRYRDLLRQVYEHKSRVMSASEFTGRPNRLLEAEREDLIKRGGDAIG